MPLRRVRPSPASLSLPAWLLLTPVSVIAAPLAAGSRAGSLEDLSHWMLLGLISQLPLGAVLYVGNRIVRALHRRAGSGLIIVLTTLCAGGMRGVTLALLGNAADAPARIVSSAITMSVWLLAIGAVIESRSRYRREVDELLTVLVARELHGRLLDESATDSARAESASRIAETSGELREIVANAADDHALTAALLQEAIETKLRPLSHDLWFAPAPNPPDAHRLRPLYRRLLTAQVPVGWLSLAALVLLSWGSLVLHASLRGALVGISIAVSYALVLLIAAAARAHPTTSAWIRYAGSAAIPAVVGYLAIRVMNLSHEWSPIAVIIGLPIITAVVAAIITLSADRAATIADLRARIAEPEWDRHLGALVRREVDVSTATILHNSVQSALTAAALQLRLAALMDDSSRATAALDRARNAIDIAQRPGSDDGNGRARLEQAAEVWSGISDVRVDLNVATLTSTDWSLLADVVDESIANAVRHGHASQIQVTITADSRAICVEMRDDGVEESGETRRGLGRTWLDSIVESREGKSDTEGRRVTQFRIPRG